MIEKKKKGQICYKCGQFSKVFVRCEACKRVCCKACAVNIFYCIDCFNAKNKKTEVDKYFEEKYKEEIKA